MSALREAVARAILDSARAMKQSIPSWSESDLWKHPSCGLTIREAALAEADAALAVIRAAFEAPSQEMVRAGAKAWTEEGTFKAGLSAAAKEVLGE